ncbi:MAG TPA: DsrE/DsrF/DrsH-like family protein [Usitatibacter sp.]|nr:DsrE/DsrF/DrsH-like family protein [Usitatibacter sp.]
MEPNKISVIVLSDKREQLQMAAMVASVGAVSGADVLVFLSMNALRYFVKGAERRAPPEGPMGELMEAKKVMPFQDLFASAVELGGAKVHPCSMAIDVLGIGDGELEGYVGEPMGLTQFLDIAAGGQVFSF